MNIKHLSQIAVVSLGLASAASATTFSFSGGAGDGTGTTNSLTFTSAPTGTKVVVTGFTYGGTGNSGLNQKRVGQYSGGLGVNSASNPSDTGSPEHSVDNNNGVNMLFFKFTDMSNNPVAVNLSQLSFGWVEDDSDFRYWLGGTSSTASSLFGTGTGGTAVDGGTGSAGADYNISGLGIYSLLVAADPAGYAAGTSTHWDWSTWSWVQGTPENPHDNFKVDGLTFTTTGNTTTTVPDAGSTVAFLGLALVGLAALKRRFAA